jgi:photosystem II stability/assembly factor-like uncharacterized protein
VPRIPTPSFAKPTNEPTKSIDTIIGAAQQPEAPAVASNFALPSVQTAQRKALIAGNSLFSVSRREKSLWSLDRPTADGTIQKSDDGGETWRTIHVDDHTPLFALSASGSNVWAGGADGRLFRSFDGGVRWMPVPVSDDYRRLAGAITGIEASGESSVKVRTKSGQTWVSGDGGRHWRARSLR